MTIDQLSPHELAEIIFENLGYPGLLLSGSKSFYCAAHPTHAVVFNANLCTKNRKFWYGDIDITVDEKKLKELASLIGEEIYVLREMDARFENESNPKIERAVAVVYPNEVQYRKCI